MDRKTTELWNAYEKNRRFTDTRINGSPSYILQMFATERTKQKNGKAYTQNVQTMHQDSNHNLYGNGNKKLNTRTQFKPQKNPLRFQKKIRKD